MMVEEKSEKSAFIHSDSEDEFDDKNDEYNHVLQKTKNKVYIVILLTLSEPLLASSRDPFLVLYIESFASNITTSQVSLLVFISFVYMAISTLILTSLGDKFGHDRIYIICFLLLSIGLTLESITNSFIVFTIGFFIGKAPNIPIAFAYIPWILPHKYSVRYCSILWTICAVIYLLGPLLGGVIAQYLGYRIIWVINAVIHITYFIISFMTLRGSISNLEQKQSSLGMLPFLEEDEQFPICIRLKNTRHHDQDDENEENWLSEYIAFWRSLAIYDLWMLLCSIFMNNAAWAIEAILTFFYVLFLLNRFETDIVYSTLMLVQLTVIYGVINVCIPTLIKRVIPSYIWVVILSSICLIFVCLLCTLPSNNLFNYWIYNVFIAILFGIISMCSEMCILELQPKQHTGKVTGLKGCIKYMFRGTCTGLVGLFWYPPQFNSFWYGIVVLSIMTLLLSINMLIMIRIWK